MERATAELSSLTTSVEDLLARVTALAEDLSAASIEGAANDLFDAERALRLTVRRLEGARRSLP